MVPQIAVIDTGVDPNHPFLKGVVKGGVGIASTSGDPWKSEFSDVAGHGTAVASIIHSFCPEAELYSVRIARERDGVFEAHVCQQDIAEAIHWSLDQRIRVINVSYSVEAPPDQGSQLEASCMRAASAGAVVIASYRNRDPAVVLPAALPTAIGVHRDLDLAPGMVRILNERNKDVACWGGNSPVAYLGGTTAILGGTSFSSAHITAMIGRMLFVDNTVDLERAFRLLVEFSRRKGADSRGNNR